SPDHDQIFAQRYNGNGDETWKPGGLAVSDADGSKNNLLLQSDDGGGAFLSWTQGETQSSLNAQHVDASGQTLWTSMGITAVPTQALSGTPAMTRDGSGGLFVTFNPVQSGQPSAVYAQHLGADGAGDEAADFVGAAPYALGATSDTDAFVAWSNQVLTTVSKLRSSPGKGPGPKAALARTKMSVAAIEPNPARGSFRASGVLPGDAPAQAQLIDLRGRVVASRILVPAGGAWAASFGASEHLASGTYVLRVTQGSAVTSAKVSVIRWEVGPPSGAARCAGPPSPGRSRAGRSRGQRTAPAWRR